MPTNEKHVFVCTNERAADHPRGCCAGKDSAAIRDQLKELVKQRGLSKQIRVNASGCLDQCEHGVTIVVYPEAVWYGFVKITDVEEIVTSHLVGNVPVARLRMADTCINATRCEHRGNG
ncbi:MAG: (2Fe-2S) ferredoxin domain-containing protein [Planctomycetota bacterium]